MAGLITVVKSYECWKVVKLKLKKEKRIKSWASTFRGNVKKSDFRIFKLWNVRVNSNIYFYINKTFFILSIIYIYIKMWLGTWFTQKICFK